MRRILLLLMLVSVGGAAAQERFDYLERRNPWNGSVNAAGVRQDSVSLSYAEVYFTKENGGFTDYSGSDNSWGAGAVTESIRHLTKVSFFGRFAYDYFDGRNMSGSILTRPGYYPFDILEFTPGRKIRENYAFTGGVAALLGRHWTGGLRVDFEAQNYAKRRDVRHKNTALDFEVAPGIIYHTGRFAVGAAYIFAKNSDKVEAEVIGQLGNSYYAFFDKGLHYGTQELWDGSNIHLKESGVTGFPVKEITQGASLQLQYGPLYADATYRYRSGDTGEKDVRWHEFEAPQVTAHAALALKSSSYNHFIRLSFDWQKQNNRENLLGKENINGITTTKIYGSTPIFMRNGLAVGGEYEIASPCLDFRAGATHSLLNRQSSLMYPYVKGQDMHYTEVFMKGIWTFGRFDLTTGLNTRWGGFTETSSQLAEMMAGDYPMQLTDYHNWENEYLTATRLGAEFGVRYNIKGFYIDLSGHYEHGFDLRYVAGVDRGAATIGFGYKFKPKSYNHETHFTNDGSCGDHVRKLHKGDKHRSERGKRTHCY